MDPVNIVTCTVKAWTSPPGASLRCFAVPYAEIFSSADAVPPRLLFEKVGFTSVCRVADLKKACIGERARPLL